MISRRLKREKIKIGELFNNLNIPAEENARFHPEFYLKVNTPYGYKDIKTLFRTEIQQSVRCYFGNNTTLECSLEHRLKVVNNEWKKVKDIIIDSDVIETETGLTYLKKIHYGNEKILYDISVDDVHCYYSNGILSHNSWILVAIAQHAVKLGKNVIYYTLELDEDYVGLRHDAKTSGYGSQDIKFHQADVFNAVSKLAGNLIIKYYPTKNASIDTIKTHIVRCESIGFKPDMIIIDYPDLLKSTMSVRSEKRHELENIYELTRGLGGELRVPVWVASQANRCHVLSDQVETPEGKVDIGKLKINDLILTHDGYKRVKGSFSTTQSVYKIKLKNGKEVSVSGDHEFPTLYGKLKSISTGLSVGDKLFCKKTKK